MPILDIQRRLHEAGRIRPGHQVATGTTRRDGKQATRPVALDHWRFTSRNQRALEAVAHLYGGEVQPWEDAPTGDQWELFSDASELDVVLPPRLIAFSQWNELWSGGGCKRRCDGVSEEISGGSCLCDPESPECKPVTRLSLMLMRVQSTGLWRVETHGHNAKAELAGAMELAELLTATSGRSVLAATLRLEHRKQVTGGQTRQFVVPTIDFAVDMGTLALGAGSAPPLAVGAEEVTPALPPASSPVTPVPAVSAPSLAEQLHAVEEPEEKRSRANAAPALPPTGLAPRTAAQAEASEPVPEHPAGSAKTAGGGTRKRSSARQATPGAPEEVPAWCRDLHIRAKALDIDDEELDEIVHTVMQGRTTSTKELKAREAADVNAWLNDIEQRKGRK